MYKKNSYGPHFMALFIIAINGVILPVFCSEERPIDREVKREFFNAAEQGDIQKMEQLLSTTPCLVHERIVFYLRTPLQAAACYGKLNAIRFLLSHGASVTATCIRGNTVLHYAAQAGQLAVVKFLFENFAELRDAKNRDGETVMHLAAQSVKREVIDYLLSQGVDVESRDNDGNTPLASMVGLYGDGVQDVVQLLLKHGARIDTRNAKQDTLLHHAVRYSGRILTIRFLVDNGAAVDAQNESGHTPLLLAIAEGNLDVVKFLVSRGANFDRPRNSGSVAINWALMLMKMQIAEFLLLSGADLLAVDGQGKSPLLAVVNSHGRPRDKIVQLVLEFGVPFQTIEEVRRLHWMQKKGELDVCKVINDRCSAVENALLGAPLRVPERMQTGLNVPARCTSPRVLAKEGERCVVRSEKPAMLQNVPDDVIKLIIVYMVTPDLPALEEVCGDSQIA